MKRYFFRDVSRSLRSHDRLRYMISVVRQLGGVEPRSCTLCGFSGLFQAFGHPPRYDAECPHCGSRERHRLFGLLLARFPDLGRGKDVIHFAPEPLIAEELRERAGRYRSADLHMAGCDLRLNLEQLELPDASVDLFVLNHVLEHLDDRRALSELFRCLRPGGSAVISCPVVEGWTSTYENETVARGESEQAKRLHFGWYDHLRYYGADIRSRISEPGFSLAEFCATGEEAVRHSLVRGERIFVATRPA